MRPARVSRPHAPLPARLPGRATAGVLGTVLALVLLGGCGAAPEPASAPPVQPSASATPSPTPTASPTPEPTGPRPIPARDEVVTAVSIPAIGLETEGLETLQLRDDGELSAPEDPDLAGWYDGGPLPGERGPAVIAGHVDSTSGPAVFYELSQLGPGDEVVTELSDGSEVTFAVDKVITVPQSGFPTHEVYGPVPDAQLRLITCGGPYDTVAGAYVDNTVVFATMINS